MMEKRHLEEELEKKGPPAKYDRTTVVYGGCAHPRVTRVYLSVH